MPIGIHRRWALGGTGAASGGHIAGRVAPTFLPTGTACEGFGDPTGESGGFGDEETGFGSPCDAPGWYVELVLEESLARSVVSDIVPGGPLGLGELREDGGELVVIRALSALPPGPYRVFLRPADSSQRHAAYSGVLGQGALVYPDLETGRFAFVAPLAGALGPADLVVETPAGGVIISGLLTYVPYSDRSLVRLLRSLFADNWARGYYDPSVAGAE